MIGKLSQKISSYVVIIALIFACVSIPQPTNAFIGVGDTVFDIPAEGTAAAALAKASASTAFESKQLQSDIKQEIIQNVLDPLAYNIAQQLSTKLTNSVVNWANGGFKGAPSFVQDFGTYFKQQGNTVLNSSLSSLQSISGNNPFARNLALQLINSAQTGSSASLQQNLQFNLNQIIGPNYQQFYTNAGVGGWNGWNAVAQTQNNPIGSLLYTNQYVANKTAQINQNTQIEALGGGGFLNIKKCNKWKPTPSVNQLTYEATTEVIDGEEIYSPGGTIDLGGDAELEKTWRSDPTNCENWETQTPGSTIKSSLDKALGIPQDRLTQANKYKELLSASLSTLITGLTNAGLKALVGSFSQQPAGSVGMTGNQGNWLNQPNQIVNIDEVQQIRKPDGTLAINPDVPNPIPITILQQTPTPSGASLLTP